MDALIYSIFLVKFTQLFLLCAQRSSIENKLGLSYNFFFIIFFEFFIIFFCLNLVIIRPVSSVQTDFIRDFKKMSKGN